MKNPLFFAFRNRQHLPCNQNAGHLFATNIYILPNQICRILNAYPKALPNATMSSNKRWGFLKIYEILNVCLVPLLVGVKLILFWNIWSLSSRIDFPSWIDSNMKLESGIFYNMKLEAGIFKLDSDLLFNSLFYVCIQT